MSIPREHTTFFLTITAFGAVASMVLGVLLALHHPLWPALVLCAFYAWALAVAWRPKIWLLAVPAALPWLNFSPWTGWQIFDEFDLLLLGTLAGGHSRLAWCQLQSLALKRSKSPTPCMPPIESWRGFDTRLGAPRQPGNDGVYEWVIGLTAVLAGVGLVQGFLSALGAAPADFAASPAGIDALLQQTYTDPMNSLRVFKSLGFALALLPLMHSEMRTAAGVKQAGKLLGQGVLAGLAFVIGIDLWERAAFPGLFDFSKRYRTVAWFWEMHVGGGALDSYLALVAPFVVWALWSAKRLRHWLLAALLAALTCYAALTTFSRGVYGAVFVPMAMLALLRWLQHKGVDLGALGQRVSLSLTAKLWHGRRGAWLALVLVFEIAVVLGTGSFMLDRLSRTDEDFDQRMAHWRSGVGLLKTPADWVLGIGLGRLPASMASLGPHSELPGKVRHFADGPMSYVTLRGPASNPSLADTFGLTQRVDLVAGSRYKVQMRVRVTQPTQMRLKVCQAHLLYDGHCQYRYFGVRPAAALSKPRHAPHSALSQGAPLAAAPATEGGAGDDWQVLAITLLGDGWAQASDFPGELAARPSVFTVSVLGAGGRVDVTDIRLLGAGRAPLLANGSFANGMAHWLPSAQKYFLPWHIDSLYLELLIERGLAGLAATGLLVAVAVQSLVRGRGVGQGDTLNAILGAALLGGLMIGVVSSFLDAPRVAFMFYLLLIFSGQTNRRSA